MAFPSFSITQSDATEYPNMVPTTLADKSKVIIPEQPDEAVRRRCMRCPSVQSAMRPHRASASSLPWVAHIRDD
eukprot:1375082-Pyramimonas_sp.AAC.1